MTRLVPCESCLRHVREAERCPFCAAAPPRARARPRKVISVVTRAAIFYGASSLAACSDPPPEPTPPPAAPMIPVEAQVEASPIAIEETGPAAVAVGPVEIERESPEQAAAERAHAERRKRPRRVRRRPVDIVHVQQMPPYGAPPWDFPIV